MQDIQNIVLENIRNLDGTVYESIQKLTELLSSATVIEDVNKVNAVQNKCSSPVVVKPNTKLVRNGSSLNKNLKLAMVKRVRSNIHSFSKVFKKGKKKKHVKESFGKQRAKSFEVKKIQNIRRLSECIYIEWLQAFFDNIKSPVQCYLVESLVIRSKWKRRSTFGRRPRFKEKIICNIEKNICA